MTSNLCSAARSICRKVSEFFWLDIHNNILFNRWYNKDFERYVASHVRRHIRILKDGKSMAHHEREADKMCSLIRKEYEKHYCPPHLMHEWLNRENQEKYFWLRLEIDEALDDTNYIYNN